jgi:pimeloyl-ACP methyl ester carboxylesterase
MDGTNAFFRPFVAQRPSGVEVQTLEYDRFNATSYEALCDHVAAALPDEQLFALGWSFSGPLALLLASRQIPRLRGVILVASFVWRPVRFLPSWLTPLVRPQMFSMYPMASMGQALLQGYSTPELRALQREAFSRTTPHALAARVRMLLSVDVRDALQTCPVPILYLRAQNDRVIHRSHGDVIAKQAPRATLVDIPGPHLCLATHPQHAWPAIQTFMDAQT